MRNKWLIFFMVLLMVSLFVVSGCGTSKSDVGAEKSNEPVKIGFSALPTWYLWHLADEKGFFEKHGVNVELVYFPVYGDSISALNTGKIDGNSQTLLDSIAPLTNDISLKAVFITDNSHGGDGIVATPDIQSVEALNGKKVGTEIGTIAHFFLLTVLNEAGMTEKEINLINMSVQDAGTSFIAGKLDAAELWEPFLSKAEKEGKGKKLVTSAEYPGLIADLFVMREEVVTERPEAVEKIVASWFDAIEYFQANPDESIEIVAKAAGIEEEELKIGLEGFKLFTIDDNISAYQKGDSYQSLFYTGQKNAEFLKELEFINEIPDLTRLIDDSFVQKEANRK